MISEQLAGINLWIKEASLIKALIKADVQL